MAHPDADLAVARAAFTIMAFLVVALAIGAAMGAAYVWWTSGDPAAWWPGIAVAAVSSVTGQNLIEGCIVAAITLLCMVLRIEPFRENAAMAENTAMVVGPGLFACLLLGNAAGWLVHGAGKEFDHRRRRR